VESVSGSIDETIPKLLSWLTTRIRHYLILCCVTFNTFFVTFDRINALTHRPTVLVLGDMNSH